MNYFYLGIIIVYWYFIQIYLTKLTERIYLYVYACTFELYLPIPYDVICNRGRIIKKLVHDRFRDTI